MFLLSGELRAVRSESLVTPRGEGERVRAIVRLEEARDVLAIPRGAVFEKDGRRVVYRRESGSFVPVEVTIGRQSISRVVVDSGLRAGDRVALRDPTRKPAAGAAEAKETAR